MHLSFLGAAQTVTGSKYLVETDGVRILVDCGLFQGMKELRQRNWDEPPVDPDSIDAVVLTHAHLDHSGYLPLFARQGFRGPIYCTPGTRDLCEIMLPDSAHLQEEQAHHANKHGYSKHKPALPLYTRKDAAQALSQMKVMPYGTGFHIGPAMLRFSRAGHIIGSACLHLRSEGRTVIFSGDVGRPHDPIMRPPERLHEADILVIESTYGDRLHPKDDPADALAEVVNRVAARNGVLMIPSFAVGRAQTILHLLARLKAEGRIPDLPIFLNSPMAIDATEIFMAHSEDHSISAQACRALGHVATQVNEVEDSNGLNLRRGPMVLIAGSGMATGGRILHHLEAFAPDPRNAVLLVGYQAEGTRGRTMLQGADTIRMHGQEVPLRAEVVQIGGLSAHGDYEELSDWLRGMEKAPSRVFVTHGDPDASEAFRGHLEKTFGWSCEAPKLGDRVDLAPAAKARA